MEKCREICTGYLYAVHIQCALLLHTFINQHLSCMLNLWNVKFQKNDCVNMIFYPAVIQTSHQEIRVGHVLGIYEECLPLEALHRG